VSQPSWLPPLVRLEDHGGEWRRYEDEIYRWFVRDFVDSQPRLEGRPVRLKAGSPLAGRHYTFWHVISQGPSEGEQVPDLRRCERIRWPRAIIDAADSGSVLRWRTRRSGRPRAVLALPDFTYCVVLSEHPSYFVLWTAYPVDYPHTERRLRREYAQEHH